MRPPATGVLCALIAAMAGCLSPGSYRGELTLSQSGSALIARRGGREARWQQPLLPTWVATTVHLTTDRSEQALAVVAEVPYLPEFEASRPGERARVQLDPQLLLRPSLDGARMEVLFDNAQTLRLRRVADVDHDGRAELCVDRPSGGHEVHRWDGSRFVREPSLERASCGGPSLEGLLEASVPGAVAPAPSSPRVRAELPLGAVLLPFSEAPAVQIGTHGAAVFERDGVSHLVVYDVGIPMRVLARAEVGRVLPEVSPCPETYVRDEAVLGYVRPGGAGGGELLFVRYADGPSLRTRVWRWDGRALAPVPGPPGVTRCRPDRVGTSWWEPEGSSFREETGFGPATAAPAASLRSEAPVNRRARH